MTFQNVKESKQNKSSDRSHLSLWLGGLIWGIFGGFHVVLLVFLFLSETGVFTLFHALVVVVFAGMWGALGFYLVKRELSLALSFKTQRLPDSPSRWLEIKAAQDFIRGQEVTLQELLVQQTEFSENAAHELKTPLAAIRLEGEGILRKDSSPEELRESIARILEESSRLQHLTEQLLTLARGESGKTPVQSSYLEAGEIRSQVGELLSPLAESKGQNLYFEGVGNFRIWGDASLLRLALENILSNAIQYSPPDTQLQFRLDRNSNGQPCFEIRDQGPGIKPEDRKKIFERFYRARSAGENGSGLGLTIAKWAVEAFGGRLEYEAPNEGGSLFRIVCPETEWDWLEEDMSEDADFHQKQSDLDWIRFSEASSVLKHLRSRYAGLSQDESQKRLKEFGPNIIGRSTIPSNFSHFLRTLKTPFNGVIAICASLSYFLGEITPTVIMALMIAVSTLVRFWQERRCYRIIEDLEDRVAVEARVARNGSNQPISLDVDELVPGDVVHLNEGEMVPADIRLLSANGLMVYESSLTGESIPLEKTAGRIVDEEGDQPEAFDNICFAGSHIVAGVGLGVVFATGTQTLIGKSTLEEENRNIRSPIQKDAKAITWQLFSVMLFLIPIILLTNGILKNDWTQAALFSLAATVGLMPELLPMMINVNMARAARVLARKGFIVKDLRAVEALATTNVLCVDKTGTLTLGKPRADEYLSANLDPSYQCRSWAILHSRFQKSRPAWIDELSLKDGQEGSFPDNSNWYLEKEFPFNYTSKRVDLLLTTDTREEWLYLSQGAPEVIIDSCSAYTFNDEEHAMTEALRKAIQENARSLMKGGKRVVALAYKKGISKTAVMPGNEGQLCLAGFISFIDPLRENAKAGIQEMESLGVKIKLLTGDHPESAIFAAREAGLDVSAGVLPGEEMEGLSDLSLSEVAEGHTVFARLTPQQKARLIRVLKMNGNTVGFMGEGANDSVGLMAADVGLAHEKGASLARNEAEIILIGDTFAPLGSLLKESRRALLNLKKYLRITASSNFGNACSVVVASFLLPFLPMRAVQLLIQNLLYDFAQLFLPWDRVEESSLQKPGKWKDLQLRKTMLVYGPISSVFDLLTFAFLWFVLGFQSLQQAPAFQTGWFLIGLLTQLLIIHSLRTKEPIWKGLPSARSLRWSTGVAVFLGIVLVISPLGAFFGFVALPGYYALWVAFILVSYLIAVEWAKKNESVQMKESWF